MKSHGRRLNLGVGHNKRMSRALTILIAALASPLCIADPECAGPERWPAMSAFVQLKNAGITDNGKLSWGKTQVRRLASERLGEDLFKQVHHVTFTERSGNTFEVITVNDVSSEECSMSGVEVFMLAKPSRP